MKICIKCNNQVEDEALFCDLCGNRFEPVAAPAEAVAEAVAEAAETVAEPVTVPAIEELMPVAEQIPGQIEAPVAAVAEEVMIPATEPAAAENVPAQQYYDPNQQAQQYYDPNQQAQQYYDPNQQAQQYYDPNQQAQQYYDPNQQAQQYYDPNQQAQQFYDPNQQSQTVIQQPVKNKGDKKPFPVKWFIIGGAGLLAVAAIVIFCILFIGGGKKPHALYIKDGELQYSNLNRKTPFEVTKRLSNYYSNKDFANSTYSLANYIRFTPDGKGVYYIDSSADYSTILYYRELNNESYEPFKVDSIDSYDYALSDDGKTVTYMKNGDLYQRKVGEEKVKIAANVRRYRVTSDAKSILWINNDYKLTIKCGGSENEKLDSNVDDISYVNDDFSVIYYKKSGILYRKAGSSEKEKIASNIGNIYNISENYVYYTKLVDYNTEVSSYMDLIDDDMADYDEKFRENEPAYPYRDDPDYEKNMDAYNRYWEEERVVAQRGYMRDIISSYTYSPAVDLYYYNGKESTKISTDFLDILQPVYDGDMMLITERISDGRIKLSSIFDKYYNEADNRFDPNEVINELIKKFNDSRKPVYVSANEKTVIDCGEEAINIRISSDGKSIYYVTDVDSKNMGVIKKADFSKGVVSNARVICDDINSSMGYSFTNELGLIYFTDVNERNEGTLYLDEKEIASDVYIYETMVQNGCIYFKTDISSNTGFFSLSCYDGKVNPIADDIKDYYVLDDGSVLYLTDYSNKSYTGELYRYDGGKPEKIDTDVVAIVHR